MVREINFHTIKKLILLELQDHAQQINLLYRDETIPVFGTHIGISYPVPLFVKSVRKERFL
jgi:hypothetical protein